MATASPVNTTITGPATGPDNVALDEPTTMESFVAVVVSLSFNVIALCFRNWRVWSRGISTEMDVVAVACTGGLDFMQPTFPITESESKPIATQVFKRIC